MRNSLRCENVVLDYELTREPRKTLVVTVLPDRSVRVKAPLRMRENVVADFLRSKIDWVLKHQQRYATFRPPKPREYVSGETFRYLGRDYTLQTVRATGREGFSAEGDTLRFASTQPLNRLYTRKRMEAWYAAEARRVFAERLQALAPRFDLTGLPRLAVRRMKRRWGSYSSVTHRICLNEELVKASLPEIDYVLAHELCHITHHAHNRAFYRLLDRKMPEWRTLKTSLDRQPPAL